MNILRAKNPDIKAEIKPNIYGRINEEEILIRLSRSRIVAPKMAGIERIKEKSKASFLLIFLRKEAVIVEPEREIPGKMARA